jgi:hypothetical protein
MPSVKNLTAILDKIQNAGVPEAFGQDFLRDLGFTSSNDRAVIKLLKYIGFLDTSGKPQTAYREFTNHTKAKHVLADRVRVAYDDLYLSDKNAHEKSAEELKGWFKSKTGSGDAVAKKIATTFKGLASYADFSKTAELPPTPKDPPPSDPTDPPADPPKPPADLPSLGLVYRLEIHLPETQNVETYRAIFRALREELGQ